MNTNNNMKCNADLARYEEENAIIVHPAVYITVIIMALAGFAWGFASAFGPWVDLFIK